MKENNNENEGNKMNVENVKVILAANKIGASVHSEIEILARYGDGSVLVGYVNIFDSGHYANRRVAYITSKGRMKWNMIAE